MTVEFLPVGIKCNLSCTYCYQEPMRDAGNFSAPLNIIKVKDTLRKAGQDFALFGGEPLLAPMSQLDEMWAFGKETYGKNGVQTNGLLIESAHIDMFRKYNVQVGVSIDGPGALNSARCNNTDTEKIISNIKGLLSSNVDTSLIVTIHMLNAWHILDLLDFFDDMEESGMKYVNLHNLEVDNRATRDNLKLSDEANFLAFKTIYDDAKESKILYQPFSDIYSLLTNDRPSVSCIWSACDPLTTPAVHGINAGGDLTNCGRTNKDGIDYLKGESRPSYERYQALSLTEWEDGGCKDCRYFFACKGQCPGTAIDGDWRNRTKDCRFWFTLIKYIHDDLRLRNIATVDLDAANSRFLEQITRPATNINHQDVPHGDSHGDHIDVIVPAEYSTRVREGKLGI